MIERPKSKVRKPELRYIVACEGKNQEPLYFEHIKKLIGSHIIVPACLYQGHPVY